MVRSCSAWILQLAKLFDTLPNYLALIVEVTVLQKAAIKRFLRERR